MILRKPKGRAALISTYIPHTRLTLQDKGFVIFANIQGWKNSWMSIARPRRGQLARNLSTLCILFPLISERMKMRSSQLSTTKGKLFAAFLAALFVASGFTIAQAQSAHAVTLPAKCYEASGKVQGALNRESSTTVYAGSCHQVRAGVYRKYTSSGPRVLYPGPASSTKSVAKSSVGYPAGHARQARITTGSTPPWSPWLDF